MLWFIIHNFLKNFTLMENQTRNLTTFLTETVLYVLFYSYTGSFHFSDNPFLKRIVGFFIYIVIADGFAMAILYKNFYKQTIFTEVEETIGSTGPKMTATNVEPITTVEVNLSDHNSNIPLLNNDSDYIDEQEGFTKDSALGDSYSSNGKSNA
jgi:hypothetical protein